MADRTMPHNIEAENSVLGSVFLSNYALEKACEELDKDFFYIEKNGKIFDVIKSLSNNGKPVDITTLTNELEKLNILNNVGGVEYINELIGSVPTASNIEYYIEIVQEKYTLRKLIESSTEIIGSCYKGEMSYSDVLDNAEKKIFSVSKNRKASEFKKIQDVLTKAQQDLEKLAERRGEITGIPSGFYDLDKLTSGFHGKELIIIASRPAMGKTAFALNIAMTAAKANTKTVALFTLEMGAEQNAMRMISSAGQVEGSKLSSGRLEHNDWVKINEAISQLADTNINIDDTAGITVGEIRAKCRRLASSEQGLSIVIIDYLQLIQGSNKYVGNRQQEVSEISRALKTMAMELDVPIIALSQLSRDVEKREDKRPLMADLRESGSIEQDADIVAFLYRADYYNREAKDESDTSKSELIIGKHRNGPIATIELLFKKNTSTFLSFKKESV